jgi:hypothetical protein
MERLLTQAKLNCSVSGQKEIRSQKRSKVEISDDARGNNATLMLFWEGNVLGCSKGLAP